MTEIASADALRELFGGKDADTDYTYYYVPALVLYGAADYYGQYSGTYFENWSVDDQDLVWINAVDGSIIGET